MKRFHGYTSEQAQKKADGLIYRGRLFYNCQNFNVAVRLWKAARKLIDFARLA